MLALLHSETVLANQESESRAHISSSCGLKKEDRKDLHRQCESVWSWNSAEGDKRPVVNVNQLCTVASPQQECSAASLWCSQESVQMVKWSTQSLFFPPHLSVSLSVFSLSVPPSFCLPAHLTFFFFLPFSLQLEWWPSLTSPQLQHENRQRELE